jgi:dTDP-4-dehydrorhamnose reductase
MGRSPSQARLEHEIADSLRPGSRILLTGAGGQLGAALSEEFPDADARTHASFDVKKETPNYRPDLVLHAAAWTDVDGAEADPDGARRVNVCGTRRAASLGAPVVYYSTDYVFDGAKTSPYVESDVPNPQSVYGRTKLDGEAEVTEGWIVRSSWLFGWTGRNFVRTMLDIAERESEVRVVADQRGSPTYVGHLARATRSLLSRPGGVWHVAADGECSWAEFATAIFAEANLPCRVVPVTTAELGRPAPRPAYSVLRSEHPDAPQLPHWRDGLRECLARL